MLRMLQTGATHQRSSPHADAGSRVGDTAVTGSDDSVRVDERTTAEVRAAHLQGHNEGEVACSSSCSTDNVDARSARLARGNGSAKDRSWSHKGSGKERLDGHLEGLNWLDSWGWR